MSKRKMTIIGFGFLFFFSVAIGGPRRQQVEHAPTTEQCRSDQALWLSKLQQPHGRGTDDVGVVTMHKWESEMNDCEAVDPGNRPKYYETLVEAVSEVETREMMFIYRHGLYSQFLQEDQAGKRGPD